MGCNFTENEMFGKNILKTNFQRERRLVSCRRQCFYLNANAMANSDARYEKYGNVT